MESELDKYSRIVPMMARSVEYWISRCEQLDEKLQKALELNTLLLEGQDAVKEQQRSTVLQDDDSDALIRKLQDDDARHEQLTAEGDSDALIRKLQDDDARQEQSTAEGERLSEEKARELDLDNQAIAARSTSRPNRGKRKQSSTTQEILATDRKPTKRRHEKKRLPDDDNDGSDCVQMDVSGKK